MNLQCKDIFVLYETLMKIKDSKVPVTTGFAIVRNIKALAPEYESIMEMRNSIIRSYGEDLGNGQISVPDDKLAAANAELNKVLDTEVEVNLTKLKLSQLENLELSIEDIEKLYPIIEEE